MSRPASRSLADGLVVLRLLLALVLELALEENLAFLAISCRFALASKSRPQSD